ncbi:MAG: TetR/AcrR family transcriptional regulator [Propionibacterium sp.]|jgi:AcrR family transcriptional regulator|nr:TetR/AcrR family transcriptional regulator [Brooklawnia sp. SH051]MEA5120177.1 TetR/AcrR family transcriptional regulator [Propionibacterium sp.]NLI84010.1 TetR/AcrR family transcriptional regulator [Propionibacterium sp.]
MTATAPMSTKRAQTQDRLMDAATALFAEKGVLAASVEEICERAGFTRGAFYSNFESKDELLLAVVQRKREAILKAATDAIDSIPDEPIEPQTLDEIIKQALLIFQATHPIDEQWLLARSEIRLHALRNPSVRQAVRLVDSSLDELLIEAIQAVVDRHGVVMTVPPGQLVILLTAYQEALATSAMLTGENSFEPLIAERSAQLIRALLRIS